MVKKNLTISEFASLRNVSIGSLRYYEKLKILVPAKIDCESGYRYYLPEQLGTLDSILLCIALDIPLKDLQYYTDENGALDQKRILTNGKQAMQERIAEMQTKLKLTQFNLDRLNQNEQYGNQTQVYHRKIEERFLIAEPIPGTWNDLPKKGEHRPINLFRSAQEVGMLPVFPSGILVQYEMGLPNLYFFFQVLQPNMDDPRILHIPSGEYPCMQADLSPDISMEQLLEEHFPNQSKKMVIISNMLQGKAHFDSLHSEIQIIPETGMFNQTL